MHQKSFKVFEIIENFFEKTNLRWGHEDWLSLLSKMEKAGVSIDPDQLGQMLERERERRQNATKVLFVCTGNIFRSMSAEFCLKDHLKRKGVSNMVVNSAGIIAAPEYPNPKTIDMLNGFGISVKEHKQEKLTREHVDNHHHVITMGQNHKNYIKKYYGKDAVLFNELAIGESTSVLDIPEAVQDYKTNKQCFDAHIEKTVRHIHQNTSNLYNNLVKE
ncbi:hypothetical protein GOV08_03615 [Candidatus Woesearchaeota archaeon]|nr:hypothetical protein [Candidatus Woesearchaeota archaeon]